MTFQNPGPPSAMVEGGAAVVGAAVPILSRGDLLGGVLLGADPKVLTGRGAGLSDAARYTRLPGIKSSRHRPVFFTWQASTPAEVLIMAINRLGRAMNSPSVT